MSWVHTIILVPKLIMLKHIVKKKQQPKRKILIFLQWLIVKRQLLSCHISTTHTWGGEKRNILHFHLTHSFVSSKCFSNKCWTHFPSSRVTFITASAMALHLALENELENKSNQTQKRIIIVPSISFYSCNFWIRYKQ